MNLSAAVSIVSLISYVALIVLVVRHDWRPRANRIFVLYLLAMTYWQFNALMVSLSTNAQMATFWYQMMLTGGAFAVLYYHFTLAHLHVGGRTQRILLFAGYILALVLGLLSLAIPDSAIASVHQDATGLWVPAFAPLMYIQGLFVYSYLGLGLATLVLQYQKTTSRLVRNRLRYLILGVSIVFLGAVSNFLSALQGYPLDIVANLTNAVLIAYAILRYQLLDIAVVVRKGLLYSIPTAILGAGYLLIVYLAVNLLHFVTGYQVLLLSLTVAAITAVAVQPLWSRLQSWVDKLFFREQYDARMMLQRLSQTATTVLHLDNLTRMILDEIAQTMHVECVALFLKREESGEFHVMAQRGLGQSSHLRLRKDHPFVKWLSAHERPLTRHEIDVLPQFRALWMQEREDLDRMEVELTVPLSVRGDLIGVLVLGPKRSEIPYSRDEQLTLTTLANQTAVAVQNAWLFSLEQRKAEETAALLDITEAVSSTLKLTRLLAIIARRTAEACGVDRCSILLLDDEGMRLIPLMSQLRHGVKDSEQWFTFQEQTYIETVEQVPLVQRVLKEQKPVIIDEGSLSVVPSRWTEPFGIKSLLAVPLISKEQVTGLMVLDHIEGGRQFTEEQVKLATTIASATTIAIENARLYEETIEEKERTETIVEYAFAGIMVIDPDMRILVVNPEIEAMTGYTSEELLGKQFREVFAPDLWEEGSLLSEVMVSGERVAPIEASFGGKDGARDVLMGITPIREGYLLNFSDITRLKEVDRLKSSIVANVSHELRAPLASIKAYTELLLDNLEGDDKAVRHRFLTVIEQETDWLTELINGLLDLSRLEAERYTARMDLLSIKEVVDGVVALLEIQIHKQGVNIELDVPSGLPLIIGDKEMITIVVKNLISNAVKFSSDGGQVTVAVRAEEDILVIDVVDHGIGIPQEDISFLFTKFYRSTLVREAGIRGTGLGLVLAKEAVEMHDGRIEVKSEPGIETRFSVILPVKAEAWLDSPAGREWIDGAPDQAITNRG